MQLRYLLLRVACLKDGRVFLWEMCDPNLLLARTLEECPNLARLYAQRMQERPCSLERPWSMVVVWDDFTPGSLSHPLTHLKTMVLAYNFREVGAAALGVGSTWLVPVAVRSRYMAKAEGGLSACLVTYLKTHLMGDLSIQHVGVAFKVDGEIFMLYARLTNLLSDGEGLKLGLDVFGHAGINACVRCMNVLKKNSGLAHRRPGFVEIGCADSRDFILRKQVDLLADVEDLEDAHSQVVAGTMTQQRFQNLEKGSGIHFNPSGLLFSAEMRPLFSIMDVITEDWMHGALQEGTLNIASQRMLLASHAKLDVPIDSLETFLRADWGFPKVAYKKMRSIWHVFDDNSRDHIDVVNMKFKCQASELVGLYTLLRHFFRVATSDPAKRALVAEELAVFEAACKVVDLIVSLKRGHASQAHVDELVDRLQAAADEAIRLHVACHGNGDIRPKHHRMQHIPGQIRRDLLVLDAWIIERLHLIFKDLLSHIRATQCYEVSMLRGCCIKQMEALKAKIFYGLLGRVSPLPSIPGARAAKQLYCCGMTVSVTDFVFRARVLGLVEACVEEMGSVYVLVQVHRVVQQIHGTFKWQPIGEIQAWDAEEIEPASAWYQEPDGVVIL